jgi:hypothetical protein
LIDTAEVPVMGASAFGGNMYLYKLQNKIGIFYVVASDPTTAISLLEGKLKEADYGFFQERTVYQTTLIGKEVGIFSSGNPKPFFSDEANLIIQKND